MGTKAERGTAAAQRKQDGGQRTKSERRRERQMRTAEGTADPDSGAKSKVGTKGQK